MPKQVLAIAAAVLGVVSGIYDWRWRRIPNWITVSAAAAGVVLNFAIGGWDGAKQSILGLALGLGLLLPLVLMRSLGAGDWKLTGAVGAIVGPRDLVIVLVIALLIAGLMALALIVHKRRVRDALANIKGALRSLYWRQMPGPQLTLENPAALKIPFGVALALAAIAYALALGLGRL
jgi:prepilin peptidase CpaA